MKFCFIQGISYICATIVMRIQKRFCMRYDYMFHSLRKDMMDR